VINICSIPFAQKKERVFVENGEILETVKRLLIILSRYDTMNDMG
jgi:hypothetical protein